MMMMTTMMTMPMMTLISLMMVAVMKENMIFNYFLSQLIQLISFALEHLLVMIFMIYDDDKLVDSFDIF